MTVPKNFLMLIICSSSCCSGMDAPAKPSINPKQQAVIKILQEKGNIDQRLKQFNNQRPILILADDDQHHEVFKQVLQKNPLVRTRDIEGATALHRAARTNAVQNLKALIIHCRTIPFEPHSFIDACTIFKKTALHEAVERGHSECVAVLLSHGASLNLCNNKGLTESHLLLEQTTCRLDDSAFEQRLKVLTLLYAYGANFNAQNSRGKSVFNMADYKPAWNDAECQKKVKLLILMQRLKKISAFASNYGKCNHFQTLLPIDALWIIYNFIAERHLPRPNRL